jgi:hypothetical protein
MSHYRQEMTVNASPDAVLELLSGSDSWSSLLPHVRSLQADASGSTVITLVWHWIPFSLKLAQRMVPQQRTLEQRFGGRFGSRVCCHWRVDAGPEKTAIVSIDAEVSRSFVPGGAWMMRRVLRDLCDQTMCMIRLLVEADRAAHEPIR